MTTYNLTTFDTEAWICPVQYAITMMAEESGDDNATEGSADGEQAAETTATEPTTKDGESKAENTEGEKKDDGKKPWFMERIDGLTRKRHELESTNQTLTQQNAALRATLEQFLTAGASPAQAAAAAGKHADALDDAGNAGEGSRRQAGVPKDRLYTRAELEQVAEQMAQQRAQQMQISAADQAFNARCNQVADAGMKQFPDFSKSLEQLRAAGVMPTANQPLADQAQQRAFLETVTEFPEAHQLLQHLGNNPDEAIRVGSMRPAAMAAHLARMAAQLSEPRRASNAPPPVTTTRGTAAPPAATLEDTAKTSMAEWVKMREKQLADRR